MTETVKHILATCRKRDQHDNVCRKNADEWLLWTAHTFHTLQSGGKSEWNVAPRCSEHATHLKNSFQYSRHKYCNLPESPKKLWLTQIEGDALYEANKK